MVGVVVAILDLEKGVPVLNVMIAFEAAFPKVPLETGLAIIDPAMGVGSLRCPEIQIAAVASVALCVVNLAIDNDPRVLHLGHDAAGWTHTRLVMDGSRCAVQQAFPFRRWALGRGFRVFDRGWG